jgi:hypothetical protein
MGANVAVCLSAIFFHHHAHEHASEMKEMHEKENSQ